MVSSQPSWERCGRARDGIAGPGSVISQSPEGGGLGCNSNNESHPVSLLGSVYYPRWLPIYCLGGGNIPFLRTINMPSLAMWPYTTWVCTPPLSTPAVTRSPPFGYSNMLHTSYWGNPAFQWSLACLSALHTARVSTECVCSHPVK